MALILRQVLQNKTIRNLLAFSVCILAIVLIVIYFVMGHIAEKEESNAFSMRTIYCAFDLLNRRDGKLPYTIYTSDKNEPLYSWRFWINGGIMAASWEDKPNRFEQKWNSDVNADIACLKPRWFCLSGLPNTNVCAITGDGTAFGNNSPLSLDHIPPDTILLIEISNSHTHWMEPGDIRVDELTQKYTSGLFDRGVHVLFADGHIWYLSPETPIENIRKLCYVKREKNENRDSLLGKYAKKQYAPSYWTQ